MKRVIHRRKEKAHILQMLCQTFFANNDVDEAVVEIKANKLTRSSAQNSLYWEWMTTISNELGYTKDETHALLRDKFLGYNEYTDKKGSQIKELRSTTKLNTTEFTEYLNQIDYLMTEYGIKLPRPEDSYYLAMGIKGANEINTES